MQKKFGKYKLYICFTDNIKTLKKQITIFEGIVSPLRPVKTLKSLKALKDKKETVKVPELVLPHKRKPGSVNDTEASTSGLCVTIKLSQFSMLLTKQKVGLIFFTHTIIHNTLIKGFIN